jgi:hypothetical protein
VALQPFLEPRQQHGRIGALDRGQQGLDLARERARLARRRQSQRDRLIDLEGKGHARFIPRTPGSDQIVRNKLAGQLADGRRGPVGKGRDPRYVLAGMA